VRLFSVLLGAIATLGLALGLLSPAQGAAGPIEDYASYQPAATCHPKPRPGTAVLGRWVPRRFGGSDGMSRPGGRKRSVTSEHQTGRAIDWFNDVRTASDRRRVRLFFHALFDADRRGNADARARRMGVMYVIWNDHMYPAWNGFRPEPYLSSSCKRLKTCSKTLRHRNHVHISLDGRGARGLTSWYAGRL
jgi:hypothetical protein